jgi:hypothetical protein
MMGEKIRARIKKKPVGPIKYLYHTLFPNVLIFRIYYSHFDWYILALISSNFIQWKRGSAVAVVVQSDIFLNSHRKGTPVKNMYM